MIGRTKNVRLTHHRRERPSRKLYTANIPRQEGNILVQYADDTAIKSIHISREKKTKSI